MTPTGIVYLMAIFIYNKSFKQQMDKPVDSNVL